MKMSDVFDLPVLVDSDGDIELGVDSWLKPVCIGVTENAAYAAHAINNHDQLTEELELLKAKYAAVCKELEQATAELDELRSV